MKKKIKIIDLLNKIANGEEVPEQIKYDDFYWNWCGSCKIYETRDEENNEINLYRGLVYEGDLNDEVEILDEEEEFEDIEEVDLGILNDQSSKNREFKIRINQLIKNQKKIIEWLKKQDNN